MKNLKLLSKIAHFEKLSKNLLKQAQLSEQKISKLQDALTFEDGDDHSNLSQLLANPLSAKRTLDDLLVKFKGNSRIYNPALDLLKDLYDMKHQSYPYIDVYIQRALNELGYPNTLKVDGQLGPETQAALEWFKNKYNVGDAQLLESIKATYKREKPELQAEPFQISPNLKQYEEKAWTPENIV
jgi:hypothetical protein